MKPIKVYVAYETVDDRGSSGQMIGVFSSEGVAVDEAQGRGYFGGAGRVVEKWAIMDHRFSANTQVFLLEQSNPITLNTNLLKEAACAVQVALKKLSFEERNLLGLPEPRDDT